MQSKVSIWVADFDKKLDYEKYVQEHYEGEQLISGFATDTGINWYDNDLFFSVFLDKGNVSILELITFIPDSKAFQEKVSTESEESAVKTGNSVFALFNYDYGNERKGFKLGNLTYLGSFDYFV